MDLPCGGAVHRIEFAGDRIVLADHDVERERVLASLSGDEVPTCLWLLDTWEEHRARADRDLVVALLPPQVGAPTVADYLLRPRRWRRSDVLRVLPPEGRAAFALAARPVVAALSDDAARPLLEVALVDAVRIYKGADGPTFRRHGHRNLRGLSLSVGAPSISGSAQSALGLFTIDGVLTLPATWLTDVLPFGAVTDDGGLRLSSSLIAQFVPASEAGVFSLVAS